MTTHDGAASPFHLVVVVFVLPTLVAKYSIEALPMAAASTVAPTAADAFDENEDGLDDRYDRNRDGKPDLYLLSPNGHPVAAVAAPVAVAAAGVFPFATVVPFLYRQPVIRGQQTHQSAPASPTGP
jgi:hypothetical protein